MKLTATLPLLSTLSYYVTNANGYVTKTPTINLQRKRIHQKSPLSSLFSTLSNDNINPQTKFIDVNDLQQKRKEQFNNFVRLKKSTNTNTINDYELQTCITTLQNRVTKQKVEIHGVVHFGTNDYFTYLNDDVSKKCDLILYELIVPQSFLTNRDTDKTIKRRLNREIASSTNDQNTALQLGLTCQANVIDFQDKNWYCADLTKEELTSIEELHSSNKKNIPGAELLSAFFQPISPSSQQEQEQQPKTRLFSNLFLPGTTFASFLRYCLWLGLPAPDLSILLLDYASLIPRPKGDSMISPIASTVFSNILKGNIQIVRQLLFSNIITSSHFRTPNPNESLVQRNNHALDVLYSHLEDGDNKDIALVYGVHHCPDILSKLLQYDDSQYVVVDRSWRTAFNMSSATTEKAKANKNNPSLAIMITLIALGYLSLSAFDWFSLLQAFALGIEHQMDVFEITFDVFAYVLRHLIVYLTLVKFLIQWDDRSYFTG